MWTVAIILVVLWALGFVSGYTLGGFLPLLLIAAIVLVIIRAIRDNTTWGIGLMLALALSSPASAQREVEFGLGAGLLRVDTRLGQFLRTEPTFTRSYNHHGTPVIVSRVGYHVTRHLGIEASGSLAQYSTSWTEKRWSFISVSGPGVRHLTGAIAAAASTKLRRSTSAFLLLGAHKTRIDGVNDRVANSVWGLIGGVGLRHRIGQHFALRLDAQSRTERYNEPSMPDQTVYNGLLTLGASYFVGAKARAGP